MGEAQRLGPVAPHGRPSKQPDRIALRASDRAGAQGRSGGRHAEEPMGPQQSEATGRVAREPLGERRTDADEVRRTPGNRHHRKAETAVERVEVEDVEPPQHGPVDQHGPHAVERASSPDDGDRLAGRVTAVDLDRPGTDRLDIPRQRDDDRRDRSLAVTAGERTVVEPDHPRMGLAERPT